MIRQGLADVIAAEYAAAGPSRSALLCAADFTGSMTRGSFSRLGLAPRQPIAPRTSAPSLDPYEAGAVPARLGMVKGCAAATLSGLGCPTREVIRIG